MRTLIHLKIVHPFADVVLARCHEDKKVLELMKECNVAINSYYDKIVIPQIPRLNSEYHFKRMYVEAYTPNSSPKQFMNRDDGLFRCVRAFNELGVKLEITEHPGRDLVDLMFKDAFSFEEELKVLKNKSRPIKDVLQTFSKYLESVSTSEDAVRKIKILEEFFEGLSTFDYDAARENWIGRNINRTLQQNESGILFLGNGHPMKRIRAQIPDANYKVCSLFGEKGKA